MLLLEFEELFEEGLLMVGLCVAHVGVGIKHALDEFGLIDLCDTLYCG